MLYIYKNCDLGYIIVGLGEIVFIMLYIVGMNVLLCVVYCVCVCVCGCLYIWGFFFEINSVFVLENCRVNRCYLSNESI